MLCQDSNGEHVIRKKKKEFLVSLFKKRQDISLFLMNKRKKKNRRKSFLASLLICVIITVIMLIKKQHKNIAVWWHRHSLSMCLVVLVTVCCFGTCGIVSGLFVFYVKMDWLWCDVCWNFVCMLYFKKKTEISD